ENVRACGMPATDRPGASRITPTSTLPPGLPLAEPTSRRTAFGFGGRVKVGAPVGVMVGVSVIVAVSVMVGDGVAVRVGLGVNGGNAHSSPLHPTATANGRCPTAIVPVSMSLA